MNNISVFITSIATVLVLSALALFILPTVTHAYSYVGNPTTNPWQNAGHYNYSYQNQTQINESTYWHYNRYPYTNSYYGSPVIPQVNCNYSSYQQYYYDCPQYYPNYSTFEYVTYYPEYEYQHYPTYEPYYEYYYTYEPYYDWGWQGGYETYCWNSVYCDYPGQVYYSI